MIDACAETQGLMGPLPALPSESIVAAFFAKGSVGIAFFEAESALIRIIEDIDESEAVRIIAQCTIMYSAAIIENVPSNIRMLSCLLSSTR